jgi:hypothetical protein
MVASVVSLISGLFTLSRNVGGISFVLLLGSKVVLLAQESVLSAARPVHKVSCGVGTYMIIRLYFKL